MRATGDADAEAWILNTDEGRALLAEAMEKPSPGPADLARWRKHASPERVSAALSLATTRRRGRAKFSRADRMWLEPVGLEQATAEPVARHKAKRFAGNLVVDLCSGIGGDALALAEGSQVLAVDANRGMGLRARWNAEVYEVGDRVTPIQALAESFGLPNGSLVHIDPDRRAQTSTRARDLRDYAPGPAFLRDLTSRVAGGAIKLGPASDFADHFSDPGYEVEIISLGGECKEATIWFGSLATCRRRATILPLGASWTEHDGPSHRAAGAGEVSSWIYDPDPALLRSGLLDGFAVSHALSRCAWGVDFLTSEVRVESPFLAAFEVLDVVSPDLKVLKRLVAKHAIGILEIKTRGVDLKPETLRARIRPEGPHSATLLLYGGQGPARAVLARRPV